jgi:diguanylate cyclase (GGDEF)-like protein
MLSSWFPISSRRQIWLPLVSLTLVAIGVSVALALLALKLTTSGEPDAVLPESDVYRNVILFSILTPALACPLVVYTLLTTLRDLNIARAELDAIARKDPLTGLLNRRGFAEAGEALILKARAARLPVSALMCDIDLFKRINDRHGHDAGDAAIRHIAWIIKETMDAAPGAVVGRQGGEEFATLLLGKSIRDLALCAEAIRQAVESMPMMWRGEPLPLTISIGVSIATSDDACIASLLSRADQALYDAKNRGRNQVLVAAVSDAA